MSAPMIRRTRPTARIPHLCAQCGRTIDPGEQYDSQFHAYYVLYRRRYLHGDGSLWGYPTEDRP